MGRIGPIGVVWEGYTSRGHLTRYTVTTSVNTGDFVRLTRYISRYKPLPEPLRGRSVRVDTARFETLIGVISVQFARFASKKHASA